jgi:hypothetical protein
MLNTKSYYKNSCSYAPFLAHLAKGKKYGSHPTPIWKLALLQDDCTFFLTKERFNEMY